MRARLAAAAALLTVAGCDGPEPAPPRAVQRTATPTPTPTAKPAATADLSRYAGKYPFDPVDGVAFLDQPAVRAAVLATGADAAARAFVFAKDGPQSPIEEKGGRLVAWGCEAHSCDAHDWSLRLAPDGSEAELCHHDADAGEPPRWWTAGGPEAKSESCS